MSNVIQTQAGPVPAVLAHWRFADWSGAIKARCGIGRYNYRVDPGLYAIGTPGPESEIVVTANYKLTFDTLRSCLDGRSIWILVLDTDGVNVWCAAGKGSFGTDELVRRIAFSGLHLVVKHRRVIVPQLGAPGVSAHEARMKSGFRIIFGPVECRDLKEFMDNANKATSAMRFKSFDLIDRATLIPVELLHAFRFGAIATIAGLVIGGLFGNGSFLESAARHGLTLGAGIFLGILSGGALAPILLPWIPGRSFSWKGFLVGLAMATIWGLVGLLAADRSWSLPEMLSVTLVSGSVASYFAMNFTGSSTFTSLSGVKKEMRIAVPIQVIALTSGLIAWLFAVVGT